MPPAFEANYPSFSSWQSVQEALASWRKRTWDGSAQAAEQTRANQSLAEDFIERLAFRGQVLDVGCGNGWIERLYRARGYEYAGIDPTPLRVSYPFPFARAVSDCLPFGDRTFDACVFHSSIDYSLSIQDTLGEAIRVLRPGGLLGIATPIHCTKEVTGERLHHYRFLSGDLEELLSVAQMERLETHWYRGNYAFIRASKPKAPRATDIQKE